MRRTGPTNTVLKGLIVTLEKASKKEDAPIWAYVAYELSRPTRKRINVNVGEIAKYASDGDTVVVPGKVLGIGRIDKKVTVAAWSFSASAKEKIEAAGGRAVGILDLLKENPKGSGVKVMK
ncbi:MAG TPA: 50S ribosomal protein L18e [Euryarchaeota archaeon]|nr:50S ribosomal protein L18e [Euryarchaeota archaeon]HIQ10028.1 50S ribosomal protein L18e [Euryarchaeota archaeon]